MFTNHEFIVVSWSSATTTGSSADIWDVKFPILAISASYLRRASTKKMFYKQLAKYIAWEVGVLMVGTLPYRGFADEEFADEYFKAHGGDPIADGFQACYFGMKHDRKARREVHNFKRYYGSTFMCDGCFAVYLNKLGPAELAFHNFSPAAFWRLTCLDHENYLAMTADLSPFVEVPGFRLETAFGDIMHDFYMGPAGDAIANGLVEMQEGGLIVDPSGAPFPSADDAYSAVQADMRKWFRVQGVSSPAVSISQSTLNRTKKTEYPELSSKFKATHVKYMVFYMADLTKRLCGNDVKSKLRAALFWGMATFISVLDSSGRWLTPAQIQEAQSGGNMFLQCFAKLAELAFANHMCLWKLRPKLHYVDHHIMFTACGWNAKHFHAFLEEDFLGKLARLGRRCARKTLSMRFLQRYFC